MNINKRYYIFIYPEVKLNFLDKYPENLMGGFLDIWALGGGGFLDIWALGGGWISGYMGFGGGGFLDIWGGGFLDIRKIIHIVCA